MKLPNALKKLINKLKHMEAPKGRKYISKILTKLPKHLFPTYRVIISPILITSNRKTLNLFTENSEKSDTSLGSTRYHSSSTDEEGCLKSPSQRPKKYSKCCRHCQNLFYLTEEMSERPKMRYSTPQKRPVRNRAMHQNTLQNEAFTEPQTSTITKVTLKFPETPNVSSPSWIEEILQETKVLEDTNFDKFEKPQIPVPPPLPPQDFFRFPEDDLFTETPQKPFNIGDIRSVKLRPSAIPLNIPKTPEVRDMMAILRKRFAAMHSPLFADEDVTSDESDDDDIFSDSSLVWGSDARKLGIGVV